MAKPERHQSELRNQRVLLYGATGYTGARIAERLVSDGVDVELAARHQQQVAALAHRLRVPWQTLSLDDPQLLEAALAPFAIVLHAAGPFLKTAEPVMMAAIRSGVHYLDIAGEWPVFDRALQLDAQARQAGVMLMPGIGFTIVASDCLLALVSQQCQQAKLLRLAISMPDHISNGTLRSMLGLTSEHVLIRRRGRLSPLAVGSLCREFDFGNGRRRATAVNWPDIVTAEFTTGVDSIEAYAETNWAGELIYRLSARSAPILSTPLIKTSLEALSGVMCSPPASRLAEEGAGFVIIVEAVDQWRRTVSRRLRTRDGYTVTVDSVSAVLRHLLQGTWQAGFMTPARLFGPDLIFECPGTELLNDG